MFSVCICGRCLPTVRNADEFPRSRNFWRRLRPSRPHPIYSLVNRGIRRDALATLQQAGYVDAFRHLHPDEPGYSLPTPIPNSRLDYAFLSATHVGCVRECRVVREPEAVDTASDHFPLLVDLDLD